MAAHYFETVENTVTGKPVANASVAVLTGPSAEGGAELTIYSDEGLTTQADNPLLTDSTGYFEFYTNQDECCLEIAYGGTTRRVIENVQLIGAGVSADLTALQVRMDAAEVITQDPLVVDLAGLSDPGADRILFWDDSADGLGFLTVGSGLSLSGTTLSADETEIKPTESLVIACSDEVTPLTSGTGKVTVFNGNDKVEAPLMMIGDHLEAKGTFKAAPGTRVLVETSLNGAPSVAARFTLK